MTKPSGRFVLLLHMHLPWVRHPGEGRDLEEDWLYEAVVESYLPLLDMLGRLERDGVRFRVSVGVTPSLCEMLADPYQLDRISRRLDTMGDLCAAELERTAGRPEYHRTARMYADRIARAVEQYDDEYGRDLLGELRRLRDAGVVELVGGAATHALLPLLSTERGVRAQIREGRRVCERHFGEAPPAIWLPECGYYAEGLDRILVEEGFERFFLDTHGVLHGAPCPDEGVFTPVRTESGIAVLGRDDESAHQVWSAEHGYPGHPAYREFYRDLGHDAPEKLVRPYLHPGTDRHNLGIKYHRITDRAAPLHTKAPYDPEAADAVAREHAVDFLASCVARSRTHADEFGRPATLFSPYDAELFGHWWFEGPVFLEHVIRGAAEDGALEVVGSEDAVAAAEGEQGELPVVRPATSSWGENGYFEVWLNSENDWIYPPLHDAELAMGRLAEIHADADGLPRRALDQAARELFLAQASDWPFIITAETFVDYATEQVREHLSRFDALRAMIESNHVDETRLAELEAAAPVFPDLDSRVFAATGGGVS